MAFFVAISIVPLTVAVVALQAEIGRQVEARASGELEALSRSVTALVNERVARAGDLGRDLTRGLVDAGVAPLLAGDAAAAQQWLDEATAGQIPGRADFVLLIGSDAELLASVARDPAFVGGAGMDLDSVAQAFVDGSVPSGVLAEVSEVRAQVGDTPERTIGWLVAGLWADSRLLAGLGVTGNAAVVGPDGVIAAIGVDPVALDETQVESRRVVPTSVGGEPVLALSAPLQSGDEGTMTSYLVWALRPASTSSGVFVVLTVLPATVLAALVARWLASTVVAPIRRAADAARAVAAGDLSRQLEPAGGAELSDLAGAFNAMSAELSQRLEELSRSRDELRASLDRLGETLSSSLDLNRMLGVIVDTGMDTLFADRGVLMLYTPERDALYTKVGRGLGSARVPRVEADAGWVGHVAATGQPVRLPDDRNALPPAAPSELVGEAQVIVPLMGRGGRILGVLSLLRDAPEQRFSERDLETISSFAAQASVAMENVMLHQEAQRLSVTDALTGLWNFRYFQLQAGREIESAARFERTLSLVIIDIDFFKPVNDEYGHQVGDEVLVEFARRLRDTMRVPDVVARYGGEEFVVLLPGTDLEGAIITGERIRARIGDEMFAVSGGGTGIDLPRLAITCSVGVASHPEHGVTVATLLHSADAAMYAAKRAGRNRVMAASTSDELRTVDSV